VPLSRDMSTIIEMLDRSTHVCCCLYTYDMITRIIYSVTSLRFDIHCASILFNSRQEVGLKLLASIGGNSLYPFSSNCITYKLTS
jgi:hypothetical protein